MERFFKGNKINILAIVICLVVALGLILSVHKFSVPSTLEVALNDNVKGIGAVLAPRVANYLSVNYFILDKNVFLVLLILSTIAFALVVIKNIQLSDIIDRGFDENRELHHGTRSYVKNVVTKDDDE